MKQPLSWNRIQLLCKWMRRVFLFWMVFQPVTVLAIWALLPWVPGTVLGPFLEGAVVSQTTLPVRISGMLASFPGILLHVLLFFQLAKLVSLWEGKDIFGEASVRCLSRLGTLYLWAALVGAVQRSLVSVALSMGNEPGARRLSLGISSDDAGSMMTGFFLWLLAYILLQASLLKRESDLTV
ncbi:MAG TPA: DUF2975 domain-containing protein [Fibrobacteraceae bacterium]|nr:DUF2975 domain-containing protein [Fibrobacteraceae bacterium]